MRVQCGSVEGLSESLLQAEYSTVTTGAFGSKCLFFQQCGFFLLSVLSFISTSTFHLIQHFYNGQEEKRRTPSQPERLCWR